MTPIKRLRQFGQACVWKWTSGDVFIRNNTSCVHNNTSCDVPFDCGRHIFPCTPRVVTADIDVVSVGRSVTSESNCKMMCHMTSCDVNVYVPSCSMLESLIILLMSLFAVSPTAAGVCKQSRTCWTLQYCLATSCWLPWHPAKKKCYDKVTSCDVTWRKFSFHIAASLYHLVCTGILLWSTQVELSMYLCTYYF